MTPADRAALRELLEKAKSQEWPDGEGTIIQLGLAARNALPSLLDAIDAAEREAGLERQKHHAQITMTVDRLGAKGSRT